MEKDTEELVAEEAEQGGTPALLPAEFPDDIKPYEGATEVSQ